MYFKPNLTFITHCVIYYKFDLFLLSALRAMFDEETVKSILNLYNNFLFRISFIEFFQKMQLDGIESARKFWDSSSCKNIFPPNASDMFEIMIDFYIDLNFVPKKKYDELIKEHEKLQLVNTFLSETFMQLQLKILTESEEKVREAWKNAIDRQIEMNKDIAKNFFELFSQSGTFFYEKEAERPLTTTERCDEIRHKCDVPVEFVVNDGADQTVKGVILNFSDSGLCINSSIPLNRGQRIIIKGTIPTRHQEFTVRWNNALMAGLSAQ
jgi:hypothetical protein